MSKILSFLLMFSVCGSVRIIDIPVAVQSKIELNPVQNTLETISISTERFKNGIYQFIPNIKKAHNIRQKKIKYGSSSLSYSEYNHLEQTWEDVQKLGRMLLAYPVSPEFFLYVYVISPVLGGRSSPWAWKSHPNTFLLDEEVENCKNILQKRRLLSVVGGLHKLKSDLLEEGDRETRSRREGQLRTISKALRKPSIRASLQELEDFFLTSRKLSETSGLQIDQVPGAVVKSVLACFGVEGVPDLPLVRNLNRRELSGHLEKVRKSDDFLLTKDISKLSQEETRRACFERCIPTSDRSVSDMRRDLSEWFHSLRTPVVSASKLLLHDVVVPGMSLQYSVAPKTKETTARNSANEKKNASKLHVNMQNYRLAMMGLFSARACRESDYVALFRDAL